MTNQLKYSVNQIAQSIVDDHHIEKKNLSHFADFLFNLLFSKNIKYIHSLTEIIFLNDKQ